MEFERVSVSLRVNLIWKKKQKKNIVALSPVSMLFNQKPESIGQLLLLLVVVVVEILELELVLFWVTF